MQLRLDLLDLAHVSNSGPRAISFKGEIQGAEKVEFESGLEPRDASDMDGQAGEAAGALLGKSESK